MKLTTLLALVLIVAGSVATWRTRAPSPEPTPNQPDAATQATVANVQKILSGHQEDGTRLAAFYLALADVIERDAGQLIATTGDVREVNRRAGLLMFQQTGIQGKYPGLAEAIDAVLADRVGLEDEPLDDAKRAAAVGALRAIAWACGGQQ